MTWSEIWEKLTREDATVQTIQTKTGTYSRSIDFVELFNPGNFKAQERNLNAGSTYDIKIDPALDLTRPGVQETTRRNIHTGDPLIVIGDPPCTVLSPMQNINLKHHNNNAETWEPSINLGVDLLVFACQCYLNQIARGMFRGTSMGVYSHRGYV